MCFKNLWKLQIFTEIGDTQSLTFRSNFDPRFSLKMTEIEKNKYLRKTLAIEPSKYRKIKALSPLAFPRKIRLLFALFWLFLTGNRPRSKVKGSKSKFEIAYISNTVPGHLSVKKVWFQHFPVLRLRVPKGRFCKNFNLFFQVWLLFPVFLIKINLIFQCRI